MKLENVDRALQLKLKIEDIGKVIESLSDQTNKIVRVDFVKENDNFCIAANSTTEIELLKITMLKFLQDRRQILLSELDHL